MNQHPKNPLQHLSNAELAEMVRVHRYLSGHFTGLALQQRKAEHEAQTELAIRRERAE